MNDTGYTNQRLVLFQGLPTEFRLVSHKSTTQMLQTLNFSPSINDFYLINEIFIIIA